LRRFLSLLLAGGLAGLQPAQAQAPDYRRDAFLKLPGLLWDDAMALAASPGEWTSTDWGNCALGAAAVVGVGLVLDRTLAEGAARSWTPARDHLASNVAQVGGTGGLVLMGAAYAGFSLLDKDEPRSVVVDMGIATVLAQVAILPVKYVVGRARPGDDQGTTHFAPFTANDSFPSGHATQAFAMASVVALRCDEPWVGYAAYGVAGLVGAARMVTRDHFASDVVAGALVGTCVGRSVVAMDRRVRARAGKAQFTVTPALGPNFRGVTLTARF
jgi:membrane-associated phospholipid phosphatase